MIDNLLERVARAIEEAIWPGPHHHNPAIAPLSLAAARSAIAIIYGEEMTDDQVGKIIYKLDKIDHEIANIRVETLAIVNAVWLVGLGLSVVIALSALLEVVALSRMAEK